MVLGKTFIPPFLRRRYPIGYRLIVSNGRMFQGGETVSKTDCDRFDSYRPCYFRNAHLLIGLCATTVLVGVSVKESGLGKEGGTMITWCRLFTLLIRQN